MWPDDEDYIAELDGVWTAPAQAIEARRAATVKQGAAADESAVAESDAPKGATR